MKRLILYLLVAVIAGGALFGWGYRRGMESVKVRDSVIVQYRTGPVVRDTIRVPTPLVVREPADTVWQTLPADTLAILADYLREREYRLDFSTDTTGLFLVDATVGRNQLLTATATIEPLLREITRTQTVTQRIRPRWEIGVDVAANLRNQWAGLTVTRNFGPVSLTGTAGYDPFRREPVLELRGRVPIFQTH